MNIELKEDIYDKDIIEKIVEDEKIDVKLHYKNNIFSIEWKEISIMNLLNEYIYNINEA